MKQIFEKLTFRTGALIILALIAVAFGIANPKIGAMMITGLAVGNFMYDLKNELTFASIVDIAAKTTTVTSSAVDLLGKIGKQVVQQNVGTVSGTTPTLDGKIQDSDDGSTGWADVTGVTFTQVTTSNSLQQAVIDTRSTKRYIRYVGTIAGTTPSFTMGVELIGQAQAK